MEYINHYTNTISYIAFCDQAETHPIRVAVNYRLLPVGMNELHNNQQAHKNQK